MVQTLFKGTSTSDGLKIGVVPFAAAVNVGADKQGSGWIDTALYPLNSAIAKEDFDYVAGQNAFTLYTLLANRKWAGCVRERAAPYRLTDDPPTSAATRWAPYFAPDEADTESNTTNNYITDTGCLGKNKDYDTKQRCTVKYSLANVGSTNVGPDLYCPPTSVTALTNDQGTVIAAIDALTPKGNTVIPAGLLWGWRVSSSTPPFTEGASYTDDKWVKAIVLLTDGANMVSGGVNNHNKSSYNAFGYAAKGHLGNTNGSNAESTLDDYTISVCNAIKAKGSVIDGSRYAASQNRACDQSFYTDRRFQVVGSVEPKTLS